MIVFIAKPLTRIIVGKQEEGVYKALGAARCIWGLGATVSSGP
jgi:hypothetical protein